MEGSSETTTLHLSFTRNTALQCDKWELRESARPILQEVAVSESLFSIGNGLIGVRGFPEETDTMLSEAYFRNNDPNARKSGQRGGHPSLRTGEGFLSHQGLPSSPTSVRGGSYSSSRVGSPVPPSQPTFRTDSVTVVDPIRGCYVAGFYEHRLLLNRTRAFTVGQCCKESFLVRAPNPFCIDVFVGGEHVSIATGKILSHTRKLDLRTGELRRRMVWESHAQLNREVTIESSRFVSARRKNIAAVRFTVSAKNVSSTDIRILSRIELSDDATTQLYCGVENVYTRSTIQEAAALVQVRTRNSCKHLCVASMETCTSMTDLDGGMKQFAGASVASLASSGSASSSLANSPTTGGSGVTSGVQFPVERNANGRGISAPTSLAPKCNETETGTETCFTSIISEQVVIALNKIAGFFGDDDAVQEDLGELAMQRTREAALLGYDALALENRATMNRFWESADIRYKGSRTIQGAFRYNMLQLSMSCHPQSQYGYPARGLTGEYMGGVTQWDVDTFIIPTFIHTNPDRARALLQFRINTLYQAKNIASDLDLRRGAVYPFRTIAGTENPPPTCAAFLFVNSVIANAMRLYVLATNDHSVLADGGAEVILSTALVWLDWGTWEKGQFHVRSVSGPDMYGGTQDDNFFTNLMAKQHMEYMVQIAAYFRETWIVRWREILEHSLATEEDIAAMDLAATKMVLPFDGEHRVHPVDESFMHKKQWTFEDLNMRRCVALLHHYHPTVLYRHRVCRIPDVLLAMMLQPERFSQDEFKANFHFYANITSHDSALRHAINSVIAAQLRIMDRAMTNFTGALFVDLDNLLGNTGGGMHLTTAAGAWWTLVVGFAGYKVAQGALHFDPTLPDDCDEYSFHVRHRGCLIRVLVTQRMVTYTLESNTKEVEDLLLIHAGVSRIHLRKGIPETVRLFHEIRVFDFDAVLFEMDSIIGDIETFHYDAWKDTLEPYFRESGLPDFSMSKELYLAYLRHTKPVTGLVEIFKRFDRPVLPIGTDQDGVNTPTFNGLLARKLECFRRLVKERGLRFREGTFQLLSNLRQCGIAIGCVSGSKNGRWLLDETPEIRFMFDDFLDRNDGDDFGLRWRPEMEYFDAAAKHMDCAADRTIIVMDGTDGFSKSCIEKFCLLIDVSSAPEDLQLEIPRVLAKNFFELTMEVLDEYTARDGVVHHREASAYKRSGARPGSNSDHTSLHASPINKITGFPNSHANHQPGVST